LGSNYFFIISTLQSPASAPCIQLLPAVLRKSSLHLA
jgi:hypothetical protein